MRALLALALVATVAAVAGAHPLAPALLELRETSDATHVRWRTPLVAPRGADVRPVLPEHCSAAGPVASSERDGGLVHEWRVRCAPAGWTGAALSVTGLADADMNAIVRVVRADGTVHRGLLTGGTSTYVVPAASGRAGVARDYLGLGIHHLATGFDHLLFVVALFLIVRGTRRLVATVTAFTVGHSLTLALATLGVVAVPSAPVEIAIALSIVLLAAEIAPPAGHGPTLLSRRPWLVALGFGLLHGLGFAGALAEAGLPDGEIPLALLAFNAGIEAGQIALVAGLVVLRALARRAVAAPPAWSRLVPAYAIGALAAFWVVARTVDTLGV